MLLNKEKTSLCGLRPKISTINYLNTKTVWKKLGTIHEQGRERVEQTHSEKIIYRTGFLGKSKMWRVETHRKMSGSFYKVMSISRQWVNICMKSWMIY